MTVIQLSGPPCAGKSTALAALGAQGYDTVDDRTFMQQLGQARGSESAASWAQWEQHRQNAVNTAISTGTDLATIATNPTPLAEGVVVRILNPGYDVAMSRAAAAGRPAATFAWTTRWYQQHGWE